MGFLKFGRKQKKSSPPLPSPEPLHIQIDLPGLSDSSSTASSAIRSPVADSFMGSNALLAPTCNTSSMLDEILKDTFARLDRQNLVTNSDASSNLTNKQSGGISNFTSIHAPAATANNDAIPALSESIDRNKIAGLVSRAPLSHDPPAEQATPLVSELRASSSRCRRRAPTFRPRGSVLDSDSSDSEDSISSSGDRDKVFSSPVPTRRAVSDGPHLLPSLASSPTPMTRMKERHRQECRRSYQYPIIQHRNSMPLTTGPIHPLDLVASPMQSMSRTMFHPHPHLARSASALTDNYRRPSSLVQPRPTAHSDIVMPRTVPTQHVPALPVPEMRFSYPIPQAYSYRPMLLPQTAENSSWADDCVSLAGLSVTSRPGFKDMRRLSPVPMPRYPAENRLARASTDSASSVTGHVQSSEMNFSRVLKLKEPVKDRESTKQPLTNIEEQPRDAQTIRPVKLRHSLPDLRTLAVESTETSVSEKPGLLSPIAYYMTKKPAAKESNCTKATCAKQSCFSPPLRCCLPSASCCPKTIRSTCCRRSVPSCMPSSVTTHQQNTCHSREYRFVRPSPSQSSSLTVHGEFASDCKVPAARNTCEPHPHFHQHQHYHQPSHPKNYQNQCSSIAKKPNHQCCVRPSCHKNT